jgi:hypothetical protein
MKTLVFLFCLLPASLWAQSQRAYVYQSQTPLPLRDAPPGGLFKLPGNVISQTETSALYFVLDRVDVQQGTTRSEWVQVAPITTQGQIADNAGGWIRLPNNPNESPLTTADPQQFTPQIWGKINALGK